MREFMDRIHGAFSDATGWRRDNSYAALNAVSNALVDFPIPRGVSLTLSSLASPNLANSYQLGSVGVVDGYVSYFYSSVPLRVYPARRFEAVSLPQLLRSYRPLTAPPERKSIGTAMPSQSSLLYGRLYLPQLQLEALAVRRFSPALQLQLSAVSAHHLRNGGTVLGLAQYDVGRYALEGLASSDGGLFGLRAIYNFGSDVDVESSHLVPDPVAVTAGDGDGDGSNSCANAERERVYGRLSTGGEIYYGTLNKSGGISLGVRFATLPAHRGTPLSATLTLNPLMGNIAASYTVVAGKHCSLATRMAFNVFSYESSWAVGMELWRKPLQRLVITDDDQREAPRFRERSWQDKLEWRPMLNPQMSWQAKLDSRRKEEEQAAPPAHASAASDGDHAYAGVVKVQLDQNLRVGLLWEGRAKSMLFSLGTGVNLRKLDGPFRSIGLEMQFSS